MPCFADLAAGGDGVQQMLASKPPDPPPPESPKAPKSNSVDKGAQEAVARRFNQQMQSVLGGASRTEPTAEQQALLSGWKYDYRLAGSGHRNDLDSTGDMQFKLLDQLSSMDGSSLSKWTQKASEQDFVELSRNMKAFKELFLQENFKLINAEFARQDLETQLKEMTRRLEQYQGAKS